MVLELELNSFEVHATKLDERKREMREKRQKMEMMLIQMEGKSQDLKDLSLSLRKKKKLYENGEGKSTERRKKKSLLNWIRKKLNKEEMRAAR